MGVVQTDGSMTRSGKVPTIQFGVHQKSLPMLEKFQRITKENFGRSCKIEDDSLGYKRYRVSVGRLTKAFDILGIEFGDPPKPADWTKENRFYFGPYLAGIIDGDGDVRVKRPQYPQCAVRISSGSKPDDLISAVKGNLCCSVSSSRRAGTREIRDRKISGSWWETEFYVSRKTARFFLEEVLPHMAIRHKSEKIKDFISNHIFHGTEWKARVPYTRMGGQP